MQDRRVPENCHRVHAQRPSLWAQTGTGGLGTPLISTGFILQYRRLPCCSLLSPPRARLGAPRIDGWPGPEAAMAATPGLKQEDPPTTPFVLCTSVSSFLPFFLFFPPSFFFFFFKENYLLWWGLRVEGGGTWDGRHINSHFLKKCNCK